MECEATSIFQVFSVDLPFISSWFCLNPFLGGRGEKEKLSRGKLLQEALPEDVKIVPFNSVKTSCQKLLPASATGAKRQGVTEVCVGTQFGLLAAIIKSEKHLKQVSGSGCLSHLREAVNRIDILRQDESGAETPKGRVPRTLFSTSTPSEDCFSTPVKRKFESEDSG